MTAPSAWAPPRTRETGAKVSRFWPGRESIRTLAAAVYDPDEPGDRFAWTVWPDAPAADPYDEGDAETEQAARDAADAALDRLLAGVES